MRPFSTNPILLQQLSKSMITNAGRRELVVNCKLKTLLSEMIMNRKTIWMTDVVGWGSLKAHYWVQDEIRRGKKKQHTSNYSLKAPLSFLWCTGEETIREMLRTQERTGVIILEMGGSSTFSAMIDNGISTNLPWLVSISSASYLFHYIALMASVKNTLWGILWLLYDTSEDGLSVHTSRQNTC